MVRQFVVDGQCFLLTWPKSGQLTNYIIMRHLRSIAEIAYMVVCVELHLDGDEHHHACVYYKKRVRRSFNCFTIQECVCNVKRVKLRRNDVRRAVQYVRKDEKFDEEGELPERFVKVIDKRDKCFYAAGHTELECMDSGMFTMNEIIHLQAFKCAILPNRNMFWKRNVFWLYGPTGSGKTRTAFEVLIEKYGMSNVWMSTGELTSFFNAYNGQQGVLLDDIRPGFIKFALLLRLLDGYPADVNIKGRYCAWRARTIFITAPTPPTEMYVNRETGQEWDHLDQLLRRIDRIVEFPRSDNDTEINWFSEEEEV